MEPLNYTDPLILMLLSVSQDRQLQNLGVGIFEIHIISCSSTMREQWPAYWKHRYTTEYVKWQIKINSPIIFGSQCAK
jgi:hypothetical protein